MLKRYLNSVKISYFDKDEVYKALRKFAQELLRKHKEIKKIILFGSIVYNRQIPGSDIDILLVLKNSNLSFLDRTSRYMPNQFPVGVDIFAYTEAEIKKMLEEGNFFLKRALREGVVILERTENQ